MSKVALITGITGQDGSYLAELLLQKGYEVHGIIRRVALEDENHRLWRIRNIRDDITLHSASLESYASIFKIVQKIKPSEVYHLAAQSYVGYSFEDEFSTLNTNINGTHYVLSAVKEFAGTIKFYFAGSSEMFGKVKKIPQDEETPFYPRSSYAISKTAGYYLTRNYREAYKLHASSGILFNHESPRRGFEFVTRKEDANFLFQRVGVAAGSVHKNFDRANPAHHLIKAPDSVYEVMKHIDWNNSSKYHTAGNPSISKGELVAAYERAKRRTKK